MQLCNLLSDNNFEPVMNVLCVKDVAACTELKIISLELCLLNIKGTC